MRRMIRWADAEGRVAVGIELDEEGHFYELVGTSDPMRLLQGESFEVQSAPIVPVDPYSLELGFGLTLQDQLRRREIENVIREPHAFADTRERPGWQIFALSAL